MNGTRRTRSFETANVKRTQTWIVAGIVGLFFALAMSTQAQQTSAKANSIEPLPRDLEIQLALSALPPHLRDNATVYTLNPSKGFEVARNGSNGFHAFVARTGDDTFRGSWAFTRYRDDILYPISFDEAGARANMRVFFDAAEMQARGMAPQQLKALIQERYRTHYYMAPGRAGVSYMMAPILRTYVNPENDDSVATSNNPHVMHYAPNIGNDAIGGATPAPNEMRNFVAHGRWLHSPDPFVITQGPHGFTIQHLGVTERDAINNEYAEMLARLCRLRDLWCLPN